MGQENIQQTVDRVLDGIAEKRRAAMQTAGQTQDKGAGSPKKEFQEITLKFGKGCVGEEFQGRDGNRYREILVPNPDKLLRFCFVCFCCRFCFLCRCVCRCIFCCIIHVLISSILFNAKRAREMAAFHTP